MRSVVAAFLVVGVVGAVGVVAGCPPVVPPPPPPPPPPQGCVVDLNFAVRDATTAVDLAPNVPVQGLLCPARDDDGYRVHVPNPGSVIIATLSMLTNITNVNPKFTILKDNGTATADPTGLFASDPDTSQGHVTSFTAAFRVEDAGDYIVDVADLEGLDNGFDNNNQYTLVVDVQPDPDANEPNNTPAEATPLVAGTPMNGIIATSGDIDDYAITVNGAAQIVDVTITVPAASGIEHVATLFAPDAQTVLQSAPLAVDPADATHETVRLRKAASADAAGPFILEIKDRDSDGNGTDTNLDATLDVAKGQYTVTLTTIPDPDVQEGATGNDIIDNATAVSSGNDIQASLATFGDSDVYRVTPPAGTSRDTPQVLVVSVQFDGTLSEQFKPQLRIVGSNPEAPQVAACSAACSECYDGKCAEDRLQRFIDKNNFKTAFPLRNTEPLFVEINEFNDDAFQEGNYHVQFEVVPDPDLLEKGDDFLIQNLEFAGFANSDQLRQQLSNSRPRVTTLGYAAECAEDGSTNDGTSGPTDVCIDFIPVVHPVNNNFPDHTIDCAEMAPVSRVDSGRLTYEGDRDYFVFPDYPAKGYVNVDVTYSIASPNGSTPVELAVFVHGANGALISSTLEATDTGGCSEQEGGQNACAATSICVDRKCWTDGDSNPLHTVDFGDDECITTGPNADGPIFIEVVDNGLNDFDLDMTYTLNVTVTCGCAAQCDSAQDFCQDGP